ncbi:unnamed protein product [Ectocarpus sp. 12 AP-2014]
MYWFRTAAWAQYVRTTRAPGSSAAFTHSLGAWLSKHARVSFFGNVCFGKDVSAAQLSELYDVVVLAYGAAGDRELTVPGADLEGVFAARAFVSW